MCNEATKLIFNISKYICFFYSNLVYSFFIKYVQYSLKSSYIKYNKTIYVSHKELTNRAKLHFPNSIGLASAS